jgi:hypothetical protein
MSERLRRASASCWTGHGPKTSGNGGMQAAKVMAALIAIGCVYAPVVQAQTRSPRSYSKVEVDKKIDQIRRDLIAKIPTPEQIEALLGPVYSKTDVDQKLNQLRAAIPQQTVSQQDLDKALQQTVPTTDQRGTKDFPFLVRELPSQKTDEEAQRDSDKEFRDAASEWGTLVFTGLSTVIFLAQLFVFGRQAHRLTQTVETMKTIDKGQSENVAKSIAEAARAATAMERAAEAMGNVAIAMNEQRNIMVGQQEIMASQRDISAVVQRAWVRADVKIAGPVRVVQDWISLSFILELANSGTLPAFAAKPDINFYPWGATSPVSDSHITERWARFRPERVQRQSVIFPQQIISHHYEGTFPVSDVDKALNRRGGGRQGFVISVRGVIWYDYPGTSQVHSTTFHSHMVRKGEPESPANWRNLPIDEGIVPTDDLLVTNLIGETEAT